MASYEGQIFIVGYVQSYEHINTTLCSRPKRTLIQAHSYPAIVISTLFHVKPIPTSGHSCVQSTLLPDIPMATSSLCRCKSKYFSIREAFLDLKPKEQLPSHPEAPSTSLYSFVSTTVNIYKDVLACALCSPCWSVSSMDERGCLPCPELRDTWHMIGTK